MPHVTAFLSQSAGDVSCTSWAGPGCFGSRIGTSDQ
jgi:hypothetical protein